MEVRPDPGAETRGGHERARVGHGGWVLAASVALALLCCLPAIGPHRILDDAILDLALRGPLLDGLSGGLQGMFRFASGDADDNRQLMEQGLLLPWWSEPELRVAFFRPLSGLTHLLDLACWPSSPRLMYAHTLLWLGLVVVAAGVLYRRLEVGLVPLVAVLLFAVDPAHGSAVGWLSARNTLIAAFFGFCAISAWLAGRRWVSLLCLSCAVLAGEVGVSAAAYIGAQIAILDPRPWRQRLSSLVPVALVIGGWRAVHVACGFGARGSGAYLDPLQDPFFFLQVLPGRLLASVGAELGPVSADLLFVGDTQDQTPLLLISLVSVLAFALLLRGWFRRDALVRFWICGALLSALLLAAAPPNDRALWFVGLGAKPLVARLVLGAGSLMRQVGRLRRLEFVLAASFVGWHALAAPFVCAFRAAQAQALGHGLALADRELDRVAGLDQKTVVVMNPPRDFFASYVQAERAQRGAATAEHFQWLTSASSTLKVSRVGVDALEVERQGGFFSTALERLYRRDPTALRPGTRVELSFMHAEIKASGPDGLPSRIRFVFTKPLEHESLVFLEWSGGAYSRRAPPALGTTRTLEYEDLGRFVLDSNRSLWGLSE